LGFETVIEKLNKILRYFKCRYGDIETGTGILDKGLIIVTLSPSKKIKKYGETYI